MLEILSDEWLARARHHFNDALPLQPGVDARLRYEASDGGVVRGFGQVVANGQVHWTDGDLTDVDVEIHWRLDDALAIFEGRLTGNQAVAATTITEERPTCTYKGPPPPLDFAGEPALRELPEIPGAHLRVALELTSGPFGSIQYHLCFEDGRLAQLGLGLIDRPDAAVSLPFRQVMRFQRGEIMMLEVLRFGQIRGSEGALGLFAGILESPAYQRAQRASAAGRGPLALAALGEVTGQALYRDVMDGLLAETRPAHS